jgi:hypothetical protein
MRALREKKGPPQSTLLGGDIYIHGNGAGSDWTWGCVALENEDVRELFNAVTVGTPVRIEPYALTIFTSPKSHRPPKLAAISSRRCSIIER